MLVAFPSRKVVAVALGRGQSLAEVGVVGVRLLQVVVVVNIGDAALVSLPMRLEGFAVVGGEGGGGLTQRTIRYAHLYCGVGFVTFVGPIVRFAVVSFARSLPGFQIGGLVVFAHGEQKGGAHGFVLSRKIDTINGGGLGVQGEICRIGAAAQHVHAVRFVELGGARLVRVPTLEAVAVHLGGGYLDVRRAVDAESHLGGPK